MSMIKVTYSNDISSTVGVGGEIVKSASELGKQASTIFKTDYEALKPPKGMTGIHLVALGDSDAYPMNRNGDLFPREACVKYHDTFTRFGHVFEHHRNKDPRKSIGKIRASAYNPDMHRIELYIWADNEKAHDHLERLETTGEVAFSMAAKVPNDECTVCHAVRTKPGDPSECDHVKYSLGKLTEDGIQIGTINNEPTWFDISFVGRPADRIAWNLKVASSMPEDVAVNSSVKQAEIEGYVLPDSLAIESESATRKLEIMRGLSGMYAKCAELASRDPSSMTRSERKTRELMKAAGASLSDEVISELRKYDPKDAFSALADAGVVMDVRSFYKYAFGNDFDKAEKYVSRAEGMVPGTVCGAVEKSACAKFCNDSTFDAGGGCGMWSRGVPPKVGAMLEKSASAGCFGMDDCVTSVLSAVASGSEASFDGREMSEKMAASPIDGEAGNDVLSNVSAKLAEKYTMYKLAGIDAILSRSRWASLDRNDVLAVFAAQDLKRTRAVK